MQEGFIKYEKSTIRYLRFGEGKRLLIALHGFAESADTFKALKESLSPNYLVYAIDLPFHGKTEWSKDVYNLNDISAIFDYILKKENKSKLDLMGYSMGGRIVQKMLFDWIDKVGEIYLIAPDGLKTKGLFSAHRTPLLLRILLKRMVSNPDWMLSFSSRLKSWGLINFFTSSFVSHHLKTKQHRDRLFNTWLSLNDFVIYPQKIKRLLKEKSIPVELYFGTKDKIIPASFGKYLSKEMANVNLNLLEEGHLLLGEKLNKLLINQLDNKG